MLANKLIKPNRQYHKKGDIRFATKKYSNPFFNERKKIKNKSINFEFSLKIKMLSLGIFIILISGIGIIFYSNIFKISEILVSGEGRVSPETIQSISEKYISQKYIKFLPYKNIIFFSENKLKEELKTKYAFNELEIKKTYPNKIVISYKEKSYAFVLEENDNYYYLDIDGYIIDEANILEVKKQLYPIIKNQSNSKIENNKTTIEKNHIDFIFNAFKNIKTKYQELSIDFFILDNETNTVKVDLENGPIIFLNVNREVEEQLDKLLILKHEKIKEDFAKKEYIDLRYGDSVYYR